MATAFIIDEIYWCAKITPGEECKGPGSGRCLSSSEWAMLSCGKGHTVVSTVRWFEGVAEGAAEGRGRGRHLVCLRKVVTGCRCESGAGGD